MRTLLAVGAILVLLAAPSRAQLNHQKIQQNAEQKIHDAGDQQKQTQQTIDNNMKPTSSQAVGTVLSLEGDLLTVNQQVPYNGQTLTVKNKFYLQQSTRLAEGFKITQKAKVKIVFAQGSDGRRMILSIGP